MSVSVTSSNSKGAIEFPITQAQRPADRSQACEVIELGAPAPIERVAALFVVLSRGNTYEGRPSNIIDDAVKCGVVADYLGLSVDSLARILMELEELGLIESCPPSAIRLNDIAALEQLADGQEPPVRRSRRRQLLTESAQAPIASVAA
jgi:Crp-like helix-turn-helix domain